MNYRSIHKERLASYLSSINFDGVVLPVLNNPQRNVGRYPFVYIGSMSLQNKTTDYKTYTSLFEYRIGIVKPASEDELENILTEEVMDEVESLVIDKLQSDEVRNCLGYAVDQWQDVIFVRSEPAIKNSSGDLIMKDIIITVEQVTDSL